MPDWAIELLKQGGFLGLAAGSLWLNFFIFGKYLELQAVLLEVAKSSAVSDTNLLNAMTRLTDAVKEANEERRRAREDR